MSNKVRRERVDAARVEEVATECADCIINGIEDASDTSEYVSIHVSAAIRAVLKEERASRSKVVVISGSTRFIDLMAVAAWEEEKKGNIAMGCHLLPRWYTGTGHHLAEEQGVAADLDAVHMHKIFMADELLVINVEGYIGESTAAEIEYARELGIKVRYLLQEISDGECAWLYCDDRGAVEPVMRYGPGGDHSCDMCKWSLDKCICHARERSR